MIKITHIIPSIGLGGVQKNILCKSKYDKELDMKRKLICIIREDGELEEQFKRIGIEIINCLIIPADRNYRPYRLFKILRKATSAFYFFKIYSVLRKDDSIIIHSEDSTKLFTQYLATLLTRKRFILQLHTSYEVIKSKFFKILFYHLIKKGKITLLTVSKAAIKANLKVLLKQNNLYHLIPAGIEIEQFSNNNINKNIIRENNGIKSSDILLGSTGRLHESKGFEILINCIHKLISEKRIKCKLLIAGEGPLRSNLIQLINQLELNNNVILLGMVFNIENFLGSLDYYIQSSRSEGFPVATIEALAAKVPVVCTDAGGLPELIKDNKSGIVVNKNSITSLVEGICNMLSLTKLEQSAMVSNGFQAAIRFSTKRAIESDVLVYKSLLNNT